MVEAPSKVPTFTDRLNSSIGLACDWLKRMNVNGGYRSGERISPKKPEELPPEPEPVSVLATAYATHLFSWLSKDPASNSACHHLARQAADWLTSRWALHMALCEPALNGCTQRFMDLGIAGRALFAAYKTLHRNDYWDTAISIGARMVEFQASRGVIRAVLPEPEGNYAESEGNYAESEGNCWSEPGAYQLKPALIWKIVQRIADYEDLGLHWFNALPGALEPGQLTRRSRDEQREMADALHRTACHIEALLMSDNSSDRAVRALAGFNQRFNLCRDYMRTDVLAQQIRLHLATGGPIRVGDLNRLMRTQHASGGFHFSDEIVRFGKHSFSPELSTVATIFAVQAMSMAAEPHRLAKMPGPIGRRDLSIV